MGPLVLTLGGELRRGQVPEGAVGSPEIIVDPPRFDPCFRIRWGEEQLDVQALIAQTAVEGLDVRVLHGLAGSDKIQLDAAVVRSVLERSGHKLGAMIHGDRARRGRPPPAAGRRPPAHP